MTLLVDIVNIGCSRYSPTRRSQIDGMLPKIGRRIIRTRLNPQPSNGNGPRDTISVHIALRTLRWHTFRRVAITNFGERIQIYGPISRVDTGEWLSGSRCRKLGPLLSSAKKFFGNIMVAQLVMGSEYSVVRLE